MDVNTYRTAVQEKLRAYDFSEAENPRLDSPLFIKVEQSVKWGKVQHVVAIADIKEPTVEATKSTISRISTEIDTIYERVSGNYRDPGQRFYALLIPSESTNAMQVATRRAAEEQSMNRFFLPILADIEQEGLAYENSSLLSNWEHKKMTGKIEDYFSV